jgi:preprotein translocase subunit YajC
VTIASLPIIIMLIAVMFIMSRSARRKQQQALEMRNTMEPGSGVRTIGGMYALVKSVNNDTVELEVAPGVHAHFTRNAIAVVLEPEEYSAIVHGTPRTDDEFPPFDDDAADDGDAGDDDLHSAGDADAEDAPVELRKDAAKPLDLSKPAAPEAAAAPKAEDSTKNSSSEDAEHEGPATQE